MQHLPRMGISLTAPEGTGSAQGSLKAGVGMAADISRATLAALSKEEQVAACRGAIPAVEASNSVSSDATLGMGTAELLLLQSTPSCHASPLIKSARGI